MYHYAITVKKTRGKPEVADYESYLSWLGERVVVYDVNYEFTRGLHIHFIIDTRHKLQRKDASLYRDRYGWNILAVPIYNIEGWERYIHKDSHTEDVKNIKRQKQMEELHSLDPRVHDSPHYGNQSPYDIDEEIQYESCLQMKLRTQKIV